MNVSSLPQRLSKPGMVRRDEPLPANFRLPLVSVIIVNFNYGRYLEEAIDSVFAQTYSNIQCIVVDNASTDETPTVLARIRDTRRQVEIVERQINDGQTAASLEGLKHACGQYVIFLDADDVLLPTCVETHIYVHLSSRIHVGFTAGDMLQARDGAIVVGTGEAMNGHIRRARTGRGNLWRPFRAQPGWPPAHIGDNLDAKAIYVPPLSTRWIWSPTSGLCYRRDALMLFEDNAHLPHLWTATDMYFAHSIGGWCGSIIIDEPVFIYRLHGANIFSQTAQLHHTLNYLPGGSGDYNDRAKALIVDQLIGQCDRFSKNLLLKLHLTALLFGLNGREEGADLPRWAKRSSVAHRLVLHFDQFAREFTRPVTCLLMLIVGVPLPIVWRCQQSGSHPVDNAKD